MFKETDTVSPSSGLQQKKFWIFHFFQVFLFTSWISSENVGTHAQIVEMHVVHKIDKLFETFLSLFSFGCTSDQSLNPTTNWLQSKIWKIFTSKSHFDEEDPKVKPKLFLKWRIQIFNFKWPKKCPPEPVKFTHRSEHKKGWIQTQIRTLWWQNKKRLKFNFRSLKGTTVCFCLSRLPGPSLELTSAEQRPTW